MGNKRRKKKKLSLGWKIFLSILAFLLLCVVAVAGYAGKMYYDVTKTAEKIHEPVRKEMRQYKEFRNDVNEIAEKKPFSVLLLGLDTGDFGRNDVGRSDTVMVATINPQKKETLLVSIPRDTYTEIIGRRTMDKINHAYAFGGVGMAMDTAEALLQIPIDYYVSINMEGMEDLVDALGGVEVDNQLAFSYEGHDFPLGKQHLDGLQALQYSRMRYDDPNGDYGRQTRQRMVLQAIVKKALNIGTLTKYKAILDTLSQNMKTNLSWEELKEIEGNYRPAFGHVEQDVLQGEGVMIDGISYQQVSEDELQRVRTLLSENLKQ